MPRGWLAFARSATASSETDSRAALPASATSSPCGDRYATRLAYVEVLADEQKATAIGFLSRSVAWFNGQGVECSQVMMDSGPAYPSRSFARPAKPLDSSTSAPGFTLHAPMARPSASSRPCVKNGPMRWLSGAHRNATTGWRDTSRFITGSGSPQLLAADAISIVSTRCSADQRAEIQHLVAL
jgi:hypothetical protein